MSAEAVAWATQQRVKPAAKMVLLYLCQKHHPEHGCYPTLDHIAAFCEITRRSVRDQIARLEEQGLIRVEGPPPGTRGRTGRPPNHYRFAFEPGFAVEAAQ